MSTELKIVAGRDLASRRPSAAAPGNGPGDVLAALGVASWDWDIASDRIVWSANAPALLGLADAARLATGAAFRRLVSQRSPQCRDDLFSRNEKPAANRADLGFTLRYELSLPAGLVAVEDSGRIFFDDTGRIVRLAGLVRPLARDTAHALDGHAGLTTAARAELIDWLGEAFAQARHDSRTFGLIVAAIAGLPSIEDSNGSEVADEVAHAVLKRIRAQLRRTDKVIRYATNRFAIVVARGDEAALRTASERFAVNVASEFVPTEAGLVPVQLVAGGIIGPWFARDGRTLLRRAEEALEKARRRGQNFRLYEPDRRGEAARLKSQTLSDDVIRALEAGRLVIARQPVVAAGSRRLAFEEALLRVVREDGRIVGAGEVVPTFERLGRIEMLDCRVLDLAIRVLQSEPSTSLSVNVSAATLRAGAWMTRLAAALRGKPSLAARLVVEMTESQAIDDEAGAKRAFAEIRALGARTAIDDFGAGYTSFRHLRGLDVDIVKIDGGFVKNVGISADDTFFVRTLVGLARHLGIETVAEWVRDETAAELLASFGVDFLQGDCLGPARILAPVGESLLSDVA